MRDATSASWTASSRMKKPRLGVGRNGPWSRSSSQIGEDIGSPFPRQNVRMTDRRLISSGSPFEPQIGFSRAVVIGKRVLVSGTAPIWPDGEVDPDPYVQAKRCLEIIAAALAEAGAKLEQVVRTRVYLTAVADYEAVGQALGETFSRIRPASTMLVVQGLLDSRWKVEIEAEAEI